MQICREMLPVWLLGAVAVVGVVMGEVPSCLELPGCQGFNSESITLECIQLCRSDLATETPASPSTHLQPPPPSNPASTPPLSLSPSSSPQGKRSYSIEHFRWGKPVGQKRHPVKVYTSSDVEEQSAKVFPGEMRRQELASKNTAAEDAEEVQELRREEEQEHLSGEVHEKRDGVYKIKHFRWSAPLASKRHGGYVRRREAWPEAAAHALQKHHQRWTEAGKKAVTEEQREGRDGGRAD